MIDALINAAVRELEKLLTGPIIAEQERAAEFSELARFYFALGDHRRARVYQTASACTYAHARELHANFYH